MKSKDVIEHFKGPKAAADAMTQAGWPVTAQAISAWGAYPPPGRQWQITVMTNGEFKPRPMKVHRNSGRRVRKVKGGR